MSFKDVEDMIFCGFVNLKSIFVVIEYFFGWGELL